MKRLTWWPKSGAGARNGGASSAEAESEEAGGGEEPVVALVPLPGQSAQRAGGAGADGLGRARRCGRLPVTETYSFV